MENYPILTNDQRAAQRKAATKFRTRAFCDARQVDLRTFGPEVIDPFRAMDWGVFLEHENSICDHYVREFYTLYSFDKATMTVGFALNGRYISLSLEEFGIYLGLPASGLDIFCTGQSLAGLPPSIDRQEMKQLLCKNPNSVGNEIFGRDLKHPHDLRYKIIDWNMYNREGNHNEVSASSAGLLYCLEKRIQVNITLFIAQRMSGILKNSQRGLPYNMLLNNLFNQFPLPSKPTRISKHKTLGHETMTRMGKFDRGKRPRTEPTTEVEEEDDLFAQIDNYVDLEEGAGDAGASGSGPRARDDFYSQSLPNKVDYVYREVKGVKGELGELRKEVGGLKKMMQDLIDFIKCRGTSPRE